MMNLRFVRMSDRCLGIPLCYLLRFLNKVIVRCSRKREERKEEVNKILMIKFWGIGNIVMLFPTIRAVRRKFPEAEIDMFTLRTNREIVEGNSWIDNVYFLDHQRFVAFAVSYLKIAFRLRRERYDMILDFEQFAKTSSVFALLVGGRERIGFDTPGQGRGIAYTRRVAYLDYKHMTEVFFRIAKGAGVDRADLSPVRLDIREEEYEKVKSFLYENNIKPEDLLVGMHPCASINVVQRRWEPEKFAELADILIEKYGARVVFTGTGREEDELVSKILSMMRNSAISGASKFAALELAAFAEKCNFFVSNDTAPVHIASAMGTPVVGIYGPNTPYLYGPRGDNHLAFYKDLYCSPCITNYNAKIANCRNPVCIKSITVQEVFEGIREKYLK